MPFSFIDILFHYLRLLLLIVLRFIRYYYTLNEMSFPKICLVIKDFHIMMKTGKCAKNKLTCYTQNKEKEVAVI